MKFTLVRFALAATILIMAAPAGLALEVDRSVSVDSTDPLLDTEPIYPETDIPQALVFDGPVSTVLETGQQEQSTSGAGTDPSPDAVVPRAGPDSDSALVGAVGAGALAALAIFHWTGLKFAVAGALAPLFSRVRGDRLLDNDVRQRVHQMVEENPGITIKEVTQVCEIGWGTAVYHLKRLEDARLVVSQRHRQHRRYFKNGGGIANADKAAFGELKNPTGARLAQAVANQPGSCQKELCAAVGVGASLAHKYLTRLGEAGLLVTQRQWRQVRYYPTAQLFEFLGTYRTVGQTPSQAHMVPIGASAAMA